MLEVNAHMRRTLESARIAYDTNDELSAADLNMEVLRVIETEWAMLEWNHDIPMTRIYEDESSKPWRFSTWASIKRDEEEDTILQAQLRKKNGGMGMDKMEIYARLIDASHRDVLSEPGRIMLISANTATIMAQDESAEGGYKKVLPGTNSWQSMLETLEQLKIADFSEVTVKS